MKGSLFKVNRAKLVLCLATGLVAAWIACCASFRSEVEKTITELTTKRDAIREDQMQVRRYVKERLAKYSYETGSAGLSPETRLNEHLFAKMVLNAFDRPYEHVLQAIEKLLEDSDATRKSDKTGKLANAQMTARVMMEAYGRALEDSQRHSVLIQEQIRLHQERVPNEEGKLSQRLEMMREWPLENLALFEGRMVAAYLSQAPSEAKV